MYGRNLIDEPHRSHMSRYSVLIDDVRSDITRFEPFYTAAARVLELDRKRDASLKLVSELSPRERDDAVARMAENACIVQWVQQALERRISSYRWALERLVIQAPDGIAADAVASEDGPCLPLADHHPGGRQSRVRRSLVRRGRGAHHDWPQEALAQRNPPTGYSVNVMIIQMRSGT